MLHICRPVDKDCKHPIETYGEICLGCNDCGRFNRPPFVRTDIKIITQRNDGVPDIWRYPKEIGGYFEDNERRKPIKCWYSDNNLIKNGTTLSEVINEHWYPERLPYLRWWIECKKY